MAMVLVGEEGAENVRTVRELTLVVGGTEKGEEGNCKLEPTAADDTSFKFSGN